MLSDDVFLSTLDVEYDDFLFFFLTIKITHIPTDTVISDWFFAGKDLHDSESSMYYRMYSLLRDRGLLKDIIHTSDGYKKIMSSDELVRKVKANKEAVEEEKKKEESEGVKKDDIGDVTGEET